ncbi:olfactory receptor 6B9-like [Lissotriton helveticus]
MDELNDTPLSHNLTSIREFIILGLPGSKKLQPLLFSTLYAVYVLTVFENVVIILIIWHERNLHTPMYFFLGHFSFLEIWYTTNIVPKMLACLVPGGNIISFDGCIVQLFFFFFLSSTECCLLAVMALDRYLAICNPLRYAPLMNRRVCYQLVIGSWVGGFVTTFAPIFLISRLDFCRSNVIDHFYCDAPPLLKLSCSSTTLNDLLDFICASAVIVSSFMITLVSYIHIISTVMKVPSSKGKRKAFSTCASHLAVVIIYYGSVTFMYVRPKVSYAFDLSKMLAVFYTVVTPLLNPVIYCFRNKDVKNALRKVFCHRSSSEK